MGPPKVLFFRVADGACQAQAGRGELIQVEILVITD